MLVGTSWGVRGSEWIIGAVRWGHISAYMVWGGCMHGVGGIGGCVCMGDICVWGMAAGGAMCMCGLGDMGDAYV